jgi:hypothetical protein|tara:strand:- start:121 stop:264 length:144 start_codon:yes stop_codon:yes gene_type:complete
MEIIIGFIFFVIAAGVIISKNIEKGWIKPIQSRLDSIEQRLDDLEEK